MGIEIPGDLCLVGFDDVSISQLTTPTITTVHQPLREMSEMAVDCIDKSLNGEIVPSRIVLPVTLIKRDSTRIQPKKDGISSID